VVFLRPWNSALDLEGLNQYHVRQRNKHSILNMPMSKAGLGSEKTGHTSTVKLRFCELLPGHLESMELCVFIAGSNPVFLRDSVARLNILNSLGLTRVQNAVFGAEVVSESASIPIMFLDEKDELSLLGLHLILTCFKLSFKDQNLLLVSLACSHQFIGVHTGS
jgi:hypothetical protein